MRNGQIDAFTFDLTSEQRQLCVWVAERARDGVRRIHYREVRAALGLTGDRDVTRLLKKIRERVDEVHEMVQFPIVNTTSPYFDIHMNADYIWDDYCQAEREMGGPGVESQPDEEIAVTYHSESRRAACAV